MSISCALLAYLTFFFDLSSSSCHTMFLNESEKLKKSTSTISYKGPKVKVCCRARQYHELDGDGDCWVERRIKIKGKEKSYFRSVLTDECCWNEPPNGASFTVFRDELEFYPFLKDFALKPLGKPLWTIQPTSCRKK